jgi:DNA-binding NarL/FixJ family response regulator
VKVRVLICDDHPVVRAGLKDMLSGEEDLEVVGEAADGEEAVRLSRRLRPDVALMDLRMPKLDGAAATGEIRAQAPETHVLVLTTYDSDADILRAVGAGATGYLLKDAPREELFRGVRAAARGEPVLAPVATNLLMDRAREPAEEPLSAREVEVLALVARGLSNGDVARELHLSQATVKTHLARIYGKLGVDDRTAAVTAALERSILRLEKGDRGRHPG